MNYTIKQALFSVGISIVFIMGLLLVVKNIYAQLPGDTPNTVTRLNTYYDPEGIYTLKYPNNWEAKYEQPVTRLDTPSATFTASQPFGTITIKVTDSEIDEDTLEIGESFARSLLESRYPGMDVTDTEFGVYQVDGHQSLATVFEGPYSAIFKNNPIDMPTTTNSQLNSIMDSILNIKGLYLMSPLDDGKSMTITYLAFDDGFDKNIPKVEYMIDSIKLTGGGSESESSTDAEEFQLASDEDNDEEEDDDDN